MRTVRHVIRRILAGAGFGTTFIAEVELVASELCANAVLHADGGDTYETAMSVDGLSCEIEIFDHGLGFDPQAVGPPTLELFGGHGLAIVRALMDEVTIESAPGVATTVRARKRLVHSHADPTPSRGVGLDLSPPQA